MQNAVLLEEVFGPSDWVAELHKFNIHYVEQLAALMSTFQGRQALTHLNIRPPHPNELRPAIEKVLTSRHRISFSQPHAASPLTGLSLRPKQPHRLGYRLPREFRQLNFGDTLPPPPRKAGGPPASAPPPSLPPDCDLRPILTPVRDQHFRGACVAFAATAALESQILRDKGESLDLSEQFVYFRARLNDPDKKEDGTLYQYALEGLRTEGACREALWPYNPYHDWGQALLFQEPATKLATLQADAASYRISSYQSLNPLSVVDIKQALLRDTPVCIGVLTFKDAWLNGFTEQTGEVSMPLTHTNPLDGTETVLDDSPGGHAIIVIGYKDTPDPTDVANYRPGGGYFAFKNSWGTAWAAANTEYQPGFGQLPYEYLQKYNLDAYTVAP